MTMGRYRTVATSAVVAVGVVGSGERGGKRDHRSERGRWERPGHVRLMIMIRKRRTETPGEEKTRTPRRCEDQKWVYGLAACMWQPGRGFGPPSSATHAPPGTRRLPQD